MWPNLQETADVITFTKEILNKNFIFGAVVVLTLTCITSQNGQTHFKNF